MFSLTDGVKGETTAAFALVIFASAVWAAATRISPEELLKMQVAREAGLTIVDVRSPAEFAGGHVAGSINVLASQIRTAGLPQGGRIAVYCSAENCDLADNAAGALELDGYKSVYVLEGGIELWAKKGFPVETSSERKEEARPAPKVSSNEARQRLESGNAAVVDARPLSEFSAGHLPGALSIPLEELEARAGEIPAGVDVFVYDRTAQRSGAAAKIIQGRGRKVWEISGGILAWIKRKFPLEIK